MDITQGFKDIAPDSCFTEAEQDWNIDLLIRDLESIGIKLKQKVERRNLRAILLGLSAKDVRQKLGEGNTGKTLETSFSKVRGYIRKLMDIESHKDVVPYLAKYRKVSTFVGRKEDIDKIDNSIAQGFRCIQILARGGTGKTMLARNYLKQKFEVCIVLDIAKEERNIASAANWVEENLKILNEEPSRDFSISLDRLKRKLQLEKIGILIDNLEPALDKSGQFVKEHRDYFELLRILCDRSLQSTTLITSREPLKESLDIKDLRLEGLKLSVWQEFFNEQGVNADMPTLNEVHTAYDGNALAMNVLHAPIKNYYDGDIKAYWQDYKTVGGLVVDKVVENLICEQFNRLQASYPEAYNLLCRMGCFRYQEVSTIPKECLVSLLWDVPDGYIQIIFYLRDTSLIAFDKGEYFLHPIIRAEAISRLRASGEWEKANQEAAKFWKESVEIIATVKDAVKVFEAYHHYFSINDFEAAGEVVLINKLSIHGTSESLGHSFLVLGLVGTVINYISKLIPYINDSYAKGKIIDVLAYGYLLIGDISKSRKCHESVRKISAGLKSQTLTELNLQRLKAQSLYGLSSCYFYLGEVKKALKLLEKVDAIGKEIEFYGEFSNASWLVPVLNALIYPSENTALLLNEVLNIDISNTAHGAVSPGFRFRMLGLAYKNIGEMDKAFELFQNALTYGEKIKSNLIIGAAKSSLGTIYRDRNGDFEGAIYLFLESIDVFKSIEVYFELAQVYLELGLTYRAKGELVNTETYKLKSIELFQQLNAPIQVARVNYAFGGNI